MTRYCTVLYCDVMYPRDQVFLVPVRGLANFQQVTETKLCEHFTITEKVKSRCQRKDHNRQAALRI